jgi:hypothetical protein
MCPTDQRTSGVGVTPSGRPDEADLTENFAAIVHVMAATRASDADRDACVEDIESAFADGRITDAERESRTQSALQAKTLPELSALVADLRPQPKSSSSPRVPPPPEFHELPSLTPDPPAHVISPGALRALLIVVVIGAFTALGIWVFAGTGDHGDPPATTFPTLPATSAPTITPNPPVLKGKLALHTAAGFTKFVALTKTKFGTTLVESAALYPDYASVNIATAANPRHTERWYFAKGYEGEPSKGTISVGTPLIDIARVDTAALVDAIHRSPSVLGVENVDTTYVILESWEGKPAMAIYVSNEFHETGYWVFSLSGKEIFRYAFE